MKISYDLGDVKEQRVADNGVYAAVISRAVYKMSKKSNNPMFEFDWKIEGGEFDGTDIKFDNLSLTPQASFRQDEFLDAIKWNRTCTKCKQDFTLSEKMPKVGSVCPHCHQKAPVEYEVGDNCVLLVGQRAKIRVKQEPRQDDAEKMRNRVEGYAPLD